MSWIISLPLELRMTVLAVLGVLVGTQVNRGIYRLAWFPRQIGPWSLAHSDAPSRDRWDRLPILGWWWLGREAALHGRGFWIRPLLLELAMGAGFAALYWYEVVQGSVFGPSASATPLVLHLQLLSHLVLISLMMVATFIDLDEQTIPDAITVPGTLVGLLFAAAFPQSRALVSVPAGVGYSAEHLHLFSGTGRPGVSNWPGWLDAPAGLFLGLACFGVWCVALIPWTWTMRRGAWMAFRFWLASISRRPSTVPISIMGGAGWVVIVGMWLVGGTRWESFLSALVGMAVGGGVIWAVRIVGSAALQQEAMGFGDVTLMAMIGSFTGWQPTLVIFFLAPFSAILIAVAQYAVSRRHDIAFGPYLCLSTLFWILNSGSIWRQYGLPIFSLGWYVPAIGVSGLLLMGGMLQAWRLLRDFLFPWVPEEESPTTASTPMAMPVAMASEPRTNDLLPPSYAMRSARGEHPLRRPISLQPPASIIPVSRPLGHQTSGTQLFRR